ncbi:hypothetical protein N9X05_03105 [Paracoccaceae bacterium]|nr:hypothetical protein [Paracoccaceae bacterium]
MDNGEAGKALNDFEAELGGKYPAIASSWWHKWQA